MEKKLYQLVVDQDEDEASCKGIPEGACDSVPQNFGKQVIARVATKTGDQFSKPAVILTWLLIALGAPTACIGLLVPVREAGSLLPQMIVGEVTRRFPIHKGFWVTGSIIQGLSVLGMAVTALSLQGAAAGWTIVGLLVAFSLARGICSITSKDLLGKTIPRTRRGRLTGLASSISGYAAVAVGIFFVLYRTEDLPIGLLATLLFIAGGMWLVAAVVMSSLIEQPGDTATGGKAFRESLASLKLLRDDPVFRRFCLARALLASTVLSMPFYVVLAHRATHGTLTSLGLLMVAGSLATALSGVTWGKQSDTSSRRTLALAGLGAGIIGCLTAALAGLKLPPNGALWLYGILFFLIGLAHTGIRVGRKTYLVDHANESNRGRLVAVSNTLMGIVLLLSSSLSLLAGLIGERMVVLMFALLGLIGGLLALTLPEIQEE